MPLILFNILCMSPPIKTNGSCHNVARLWTIGQQAKSDQDILDALHPWNDNKELYFYNNLPRLLFISGVLTCLFGWGYSCYIPFYFKFYYRRTVLFFGLSYL